MSACRYPVHIYAGITEILNRSFVALFIFFRQIEGTVISYESVSTSFRTDRLKREMQMVQLSYLPLGCNAIL